MVKLSNDAINFRGIIVFCIGERIEYEKHKGTGFGHANNTADTVLFWEKAKQQIEVYQNKLTKEELDTITRGLRRKYGQLPPIINRLLENVQPHEIEHAAV